MNNALIYVRVSTEEQAEEGHHSLAAQRRICEKSAQEQGYAIVATFEDLGRTATNMRRPGLQDLLLRCREDQSVAAVFVQDTDRLARNTQDHLTIKAILAKHDIRLISASQPMLEDSAEGNMIDTIIASVNQFQSDITARKTLKGLHEKVRGGGWPGQAPLGYRNVGLANGEKVVEIDPAIAPLVRELFRLYATGRFSVSSLGDVLATKGLRSRSGRRIHITKLYEMLRNPFYAGEVRWDGLVARGRHEPLIDPELFRHVAEMLAAKSHFASRARRHDFLLRGFIYCDRCERLCIGEAHPRKRKSYYRCHTTRCEPCLAVVTATNEVRAHVAHLQLSQDFSAQLLGDIQTHATNHSTAVEAKRRALANQRNLLLQKRRAAAERLLAKHIPDEDYVYLRNVVDAQLSAVEGQIASLSRQQTPLSEIGSELHGMFENLGKTYDRASNTLKRLYLSLFWKRFIAHGGHITTAIPTKLNCAIAPAHHMVATVRTGSVWGPSSEIVRPFMELMLDGQYVQGLVAQLQEIRLLEQREGIQRDPTPFSRAMSDTEDMPTASSRARSRRVRDL